MSEPFYLTTPIYYVNDRPHIGHLYTTTLADATARFQRLMGREVFFLTGTDEHAAKVVDAARERGLEPLVWADRNAALFKECFVSFGLSHDDFIRTTERRHIERVEEYFRQLLDSGDVYLGEYEGWYDAGQEEYVPENKAKETEYTSPISGKPLVRKREANYFFKLSAYADDLTRMLNEGEVEVLPTARRNEVLGRIRDGLNDVPISRTGAEGWGISVPGDPEHTIYVWIDALFNYLSTVDTDQRRHLWPADVHYIGKDILWFHTVIWFSMLRALGRRPGYEWVKLPRAVYAHSFWMAEGRKMSKSLGNFIDLERLTAYREKFGLDTLRYFLATQGPLGTMDSDFRHDRYVEVYNQDLANTLGNCVSRVVKMTHKWFGGQAPDPAGHPELTEHLEQAAATAQTEAVAAFERYDTAGAAGAAIGLVRAVDGFIEQTQPFKRIKDPERRTEVAAILYAGAEALRVASVLLWPVLPGRIEALWDRLGCSAYASQLNETGRGALATWAGWGGLTPGTPLAKGKALFPRVRPEDAALPHPAPPQKEAAPEEEKEEAMLISYDDFKSMDIKVAEVQACEAVPKADRLLKLELLIAGGEVRTVLSGIRQWYQPEELIGRQVVYLANLAPRKIRGVVSEGMVLCANGPEGEAILLHPEKRVQAGSPVS